MKDESPICEEVVIKGYPRSTRWLEGQQIMGVGNLLLTNERLVFLNQVVLTNEESANFRKLSERATVNRMMDFALTLHISSLISVKVGLLSLLPFPRPCLRI